MLRCYIMHYLLVALLNLHFSDVLTISFLFLHTIILSIDMVAEARMYNLLQDMGRKHVLKNGEMTAPGLNFISVGHRPSLLAFHDKRLRLNGEDKPSIENIEKSALNIEQTVKNVSNL